MSCVSFKVCTQLWTAFFIFGSEISDIRISEGIVLNRISSSSSFWSGMKISCSRHNCIEARLVKVADFYNSLTNSMKQSPSWEASSCWVFCGTQMFVIAYTSSRRWRLGLPTGLFPSRFPTKTFYTFLSLVYIWRKQKGNVILFLIELRTTLWRRIREWR
jgi:hypothetical protein